MCGIFGVVHLNRETVDTAVVQRAVSTIRHRGPDDEGYLLYNSQSGRVTTCGGADTDPRLSLPAIEYHAGQPNDLAFGFRRLAILDLSPTGHQPMASADGRYWIIYNGEIYNYLELREELRRAGFTFASSSDTEVLLAAYAHWGKAALNRLVGMFAFAILDAQERRIFLGRDFFGIKPLYYTADENHFAFASEIKALLELPWVRRQVNPRGLYSYLRLSFTDHDEQTLFANIYQLSPAHTLEVDLSARRPLAPQRFWELKMRPPAALSFAEAAAHLQELFLENVRLHLRSDVPVGSALSGGIDSSSIVMAMRALQGDGLEMHSFSYIAEDAAVNEEKWVDLVGAAAKATIHKTRPAPDELVSDLDHLIHIQDEPFGSTSIYAQHRVFRIAHECGIKVMEDGQGADELLAGYIPYLSARFKTLLTAGRLEAAGRLMSTAAGMPDRHQRVVFFGNILRYFLPDPVLHLALRMSGRESSWLDLDWFEQRGVQPVQVRKPRAAEQLRAELYRTFTQTSLPMLLRYEDRNSMAFSIESRVPFLTPALAEFVFSLPEAHLIADDGTTKAVFRHAMQGIVPQEVLARRDKIGFATPEQRWLAQLRPWIDGLFNSPAAGQAGGLRMASVRQHWQEIQAGRRPFDFRVWRWINLIRWAEVYQVEWV